MGYMRRTALIIVCGGSYLSTRTASDQLEGMGLEYVLSLKFLRLEIDQMAKRYGCRWAGRQDSGKNASSSDAAIAIMMWEHSNQPLMPKRITPSN